jgi:hypothetical protein
LKDNLAIFEPYLCRAEAGTALFRLSEGSRRTEVGTISLPRLQIGSINLPLHQFCRPVAVSFIAAFNAELRFRALGLYHDKNKRRTDCGRETNEEAFDADRAG